MPETSCSRILWARSGISLVGVVLVFVFSVGIVISSKSWKVHGVSGTSTAYKPSAWHVKQAHDQRQLDGPGSRLHVHAAVDAPYLAGDVRRRVRGQVWGVNGGMDM